MRINYVSKNSFGLKTPENFPELLTKQCVNFSLKKAKVLTEALRNIAPDNVKITNLYVTSRKNSLFGPRYNMMGADFERITPSGTVEKKDCGRLIVDKKHLSVEDIIKVIKEETIKLFS